MAYNPNAYQFYQPANGLNRVDSIDELSRMHFQANSVSQPYFLSSDNVFFVVTTDASGISTTKRYRFEEDPIKEPEYVTKDDLEAMMSKIMEAINGQHSVPEPTAE